MLLFDAVIPLRSNVAPEATVTEGELLDPIAPALLSCKRPALTAIFPVKVLAPLSINVPVPFLVIPPLSVPMMEAMVVVEAPSTVRFLPEPVIVPIFERVILPAVALMVESPAKVTRPM